MGFERIATLSFDTPLKDA